MSNLRPMTLDDIIGQEQVVERLRITIDSAITRQEVMPHMIFDGPPGLGKTTLANAIAETRGVPIDVAIGGNLKSIKNILPYLMKLKRHSILFIDEIHRLPVVVSEFLYPVMEDHRMDVGGEDALSMELPEFTMIGATTEVGSLPRPMYDRFTYKFQLRLYNVKSITQIIMGSAKKLDLIFEESAANNLAKRSRGTPRVANNFLIWIRDFCASRSHQIVSNAIVDEAMGMIGVDANGVQERDRTYLRALKRSGKPMGLKSLVDATNIDEDTIQNVIEPFLIRHNLISRTQKGRVLV